MLWRSAWNWLGRTSCSCCSCCCCCRGERLWMQNDLTLHDHDAMMNCSQPPPTLLFFLVRWLRRSSHLNPDWFYLSGTGLPRLSCKRGRLNGRSSSSNFILCKFWVLYFCCYVSFTPSVQSLEGSHTRLMALEGYLTLRNQSCAVVKRILMRPLWHLVITFEVNCQQTVAVVTDCQQGSSLAARSLLMSLM